MVSKKKVASNQRYTDKTYKLINVKLRLVDDAEIIKSLEEAQAKGQTYRDWIREIYYK